MSEPLDPRAAPAAIPLALGPPQRRLFGWYHAASGAGARGAVVLCNPLGIEMTRACRSYRHLAERLAASGLAVLRFDLHGTGDSAGEETDPGRCAAWVADVGDACDELRRRTGAARLSMVGLRLGATLAAHVAAGRDDVEHLVLWGPSPSGAAWVADMVKQHKLYLRLVPQDGPAEPGGAEMLGAFLPDAAIAELGAVDLYALAKAPARRILVVEDAPLRERDRLRAHLEALGAATEWAQHPGQKFLITVPHRAPLPDAPLETIARWLDEAHADRPRLPPVGASPPASPVEFPVGERPIRFGPRGTLFGVLTLPGEVAPGRPGIVLFNAGTVNRVGPHRNGVTMARSWAALGFAVLRVDLSGIGDSPAAEGCPENLTYPRDGYADAGAAMDALAIETGTARCVLAGLCSGGDITFQMAHRDPRVVGAVIMNPRTFLELDLGKVEGQDAAHPDLALAGDASAARVPRMLSEIAARGVDALLVVSERDPGIDFVDRYAREAMRAVERQPGFRRVDLPATDHTFTARAAQRRVAALVLEEFLPRHLDAKGA